MPESMKCVMVFDPKDSDEETVTKFVNWLRDNNRIPKEYSLEQRLIDSSKVMCLRCSKQSPRNKRSYLCSGCFDYYTERCRQDVKKSMQRV